ncbi:uncharacterized protein LOC141618299 [Silene latifolia]|uniref:uncharacterized protein LOC141618299 n=1 Tax=Silene latifolia TaxID=37657 RepID=UPI003D76B8F6
MEFLAQIWLDSDYLSLVISASAWAAFSCIVSNSLILAKATASYCSEVHILISSYITKLYFNVISLDEAEDSDINSVEDASEWTEVTGSNPPWELLEGFVRKIWAAYKIDKISFLPNGVFLTEDCRLVKERVQFVPIWLRLYGMPLKFWSKTCLEKLAGLLGKFIKRDGATEDRTRLVYARLLVEVEVGQEFPEKLHFLDEMGKEVSILVDYEWKPSVYSSCKGIGHTSEMCKKNKINVPLAKPVPKQPQQVWTPVQRNKVPYPPKVPEVPFGGLTYHNSSLLTPVPVIQQISRQEHVTPVNVSPAKSYAEVLTASPTSRANLNGRSKEPPGLVNNIGLCGLVETKIKEHDFDSVLQVLGTHWKGINNYDHHHHRGRIWTIWDPQVFGVTPLHMNAQVITVQADISDFRGCGHYCGFNDIKGQGAFFTWNNKKAPATRGFSRIDRFLVNVEWMDLYPNAYAYFLPEGLFDHTPIINGTLMFKLVTKLKNLKKPLRMLNRNGFSDIGKRVVVAKALLEELQLAMHVNPTDLGLLVAETDADESYRQLCKMHYSFLSQKAKADWLSHGDENSKFFHSQIRARQVHNRVMSIHGLDGCLYSTCPEIEEAFLDYYKSLLGSSMPTKHVHVPTIRKGKLLTKEHHSLLLAVVTDIEIKECLFDIGSSKSPGPDGFSSQFFKDSWETVWGDVTAAIKDFFRLVLAMVLCNRIGKVLPDIVSVNQGGFIKGKNIVENVLICQDLMLRAFATFSAASGLCLNKNKFEIYFNGVKTDTVDAILQVSGFHRGTLPFSWSWKKIVLIMSIFKQAYVSNNWLNSSKEYSVKAGYDWLRGQQPKVDWS